MAVAALSLTPTVIRKRPSGGTHQIPFAARIHHPAHSAKRSAPGNNMTGAPGCSVEPFPGDEAATHDPAARSHPIQFLPVVTPGREETAFGGDLEHLRLPDLSHPLKLADR